MIESTVIDDSTKEQETGAPKKRTDHYNVYGATIHHGDREERWFFAEYNSGRLLEKVNGEPSQALEELARDVILRSWAPKEKFLVSLSYDIPTPDKYRDLVLMPMVLSEEEQQFFGEALHKLYERESQTHTPTITKS